MALQYDSLSSESRTAMARELVVMGPVRREVQSLAQDQADQGTWPYRSR